MYNDICESACLGVYLRVNEMNAKEQLVDNLMKTSSQLFKFHGEVAMQLFLNDELKLPSIVEICVERKRLSDIVKVIPQSYALLYIDKQDQAIAKEDLSLSKLQKFMCNMMIQQ